MLYYEKKRNTTKIGLSGLKGERLLARRERASKGSNRLTSTADASEFVALAKHGNSNMLKLIVTTFLGLMLLASSAMAEMSETITRHEKDTSWLFISSANGLSFDGTTLTLSEVSPHVMMFTDRPRRVAESIALQAFVDAWTKGGDDSFQKDPPNAGITVWADGAYQVSVVELSDPVYDGQKLSFRIKPIEGQLPKSGQQTSVFIDGGCSPWDPRC